jgi:hypothetical protein
MDIKFDFDLLQRQIEANDVDGIVDVNVLLEYKGSKAWEINDALSRGTMFSKGDKRFIHELDYVIDALPRSNLSNVLYRGLSENEMTYTFTDPTNAQHPTLFEWYKGNVGDCVLIRSYVSTSYSPIKALDFSDGILLKFVIPPNFPMLAIDALIESKYPFTPVDAIQESEDEILLPRGKFYHITSARQITLRGKKFVLFTLDPSLCKQTNVV